MLTIETLRMQQNIELCFIDLHPISFPESAWDQLQARRLKNEIMIYHIMHEHVKREHVNS